MKKDFSSDKTFKHLAGAQEMLGVCMYMLEGPGKDGGDYYRYFESAIVTYQSKCNAVVYAVRATMFATEMLATKGRFREAVSRAGAGALRMVWGRL